MSKFRKPFERLSNVDECQVMQVIQIKSLVGEGSPEGSPMRQIVEYFSLEGERLARVDKYLNESDINELGIWSEESSATPHT